MKAYFLNCIFIFKLTFEAVHDGFFGTFFDFDCFIKSRQTTVILFPLLNLLIPWCHLTMEYVIKKHTINVLPHLICIASVEFWRDSFAPSLGSAYHFMSRFCLI